MSRQSLSACHALVACFLLLACGHLFSLVHAHGLNDHALSQQIQDPLLAAPLLRRRDLDDMASGATSSSGGSSLERMRPWRPKMMPISRQSSWNSVTSQGPSSVGSSHSLLSAVSSFADARAGDKPSLHHSHSFNGKISTPQPNGESIGLDHCAICKSTIRAHEPTSILDCKHRFDQGCLEAVQSAYRKKPHSCGICYGAAKMMLKRQGDNQRAESLSTKES